MSGNSMFNNFTNINTTYMPNPFQPNYPPATCTQATQAQPNKPYEITSQDRKTILGYFWYYGNSVELIFDVSGEATQELTQNYISVEDILLTLKLEAKIFNFRYEPIMLFSNDPLVSNNEIKINSNQLTLSINNELSSQLVKGKYYLELVASHTDGYNETLFSSQQNNITFEVR